MTVEEMANKIYQIQCELEYLQCGLQQICPHEKFKRRTRMKNYMEDETYIYKCIICHKEFESRYFDNEFESRVS